MSKRRASPPRQRRRSTSLSGDDQSGDAESTGERPLIVTLKLDAPSFARFDELRRRHFPAALNHLAAHLTLFHKLDGARRRDIVTTLADAARCPAPQLQVIGVRRLGRGVAFDIGAPDLVLVRARLARAWAEMLTPQDRQTFRPHVTVQNKVQPDQAAALAHELAAGFVPWTAVGEALLLWRYLGGPWSLEAELPFEMRQDAAAYPRTSTET